MRYAVLKPFSDPVHSNSWSTFIEDITLTHKWIEPANNASIAVQKQRL
jgi:hypothetical protein